MKKRKQKQDKKQTEETVPPNYDYVGCGVDKNNVEERLIITVVILFFPFLIVFGVLSKIFIESIIRFGYYLLNLIS